MVEVPVGSNQKNALTPYGIGQHGQYPVYLRRRVPGYGRNHQRAPGRKTSSMGFGAALKDRFDEDPESAEPGDQRGSEGVRHDPGIPGPPAGGGDPSEKLTEDMLVRILKKPKNAILKAVCEAAGDG